MKLEEGVERVKIAMEEAALLTPLPISEQVPIWNEQPVEQRISRACWMLQGLSELRLDPDDLIDAHFDYVVDDDWITYHVNVTMRRKIERVFMTVSVE